MISAKEIRDKYMEAKREEVKQEIIDAVQSKIERRPLCFNVTYVYYMDDILQKELEEAGYTVEQKREKFLSSEIYWVIRWYL